MQVPPGLAGAAHDVLHTWDSALSQYDEEVIADRAQKRPTRRAPVDPPQPFIKAWMPVSHPGQCRHDSARGENERQGDKKKKRDGSFKE
jgi:hypothetical protein